MANIFLVSDTHFNHAAMLKFTFGGWDELVRPGFSGVHEMNEHMIQQWNSVVKPTDHIYHLGDIAMHTSSGDMAAIVRRLNGEKRLIPGNHDACTPQQYLKMGFKKIFGMRLLFDVWLTHCPIHVDNMGKAIGNAHGHIHRNPSPKGPYCNVSVEAINYTPISLDEVRDRIKKKVEQENSLTRFYIGGETQHGTENSGTSSISSRTNIELGTSLQFPGVDWRKASS